MEIGLQPGLWEAMTGSEASRAGRPMRLQTELATHARYAGEASVCPILRMSSWFWRADQSHIVVQGANEGIDASDSIVFGVGDS